MIGETKTETEDEENEVSEAEIDEPPEESFPASDSPSWTLGQDPHPKRRDASEKKQAK